MTTTEKAALENLAARMAARRARKPAQAKLGLTATGAWRGLATRPDGSTILVVVPAR
jgi:hypothetical protein